MTITLNSDYDVTLSTALLGYVGETNARHVSVEGMEVDGADRYVLTIDYGDGVQYEVDITGGQWTPTADILRSAQTVSCQIVAKKLSGDEYVLVKKSRIFRLRIGSAIGDNAVPSPDVAVDALDRIDAIGRQVEADVARAEQAASTAMQAAETLVSKADSAEKSAQRAEQARDTAVSAEKTATQSADTAVKSADTAQKSADAAVKSANSAQAASKTAVTSAEQAHADMQTAVTTAETATTAAENAKKSATNAGLSADTAEQAAERAETAQASAETSATQADTAMQGAETARAEAVTAQNNAKTSADQASASAKQTTADKTITAGYAKTAKTCADSTTADKQAVQTLAEQVTADKATVADHAAKVAEDRTAAETAAQTAQAVADSLPDDYTTAVAKIAENTAEISAAKLTDKELQRRVNALYDIGQGVTHQFETDSETAYAKTVPTGAKLMSVKNIGGRSIVWNQLISQIVEKTSNGIATTKIDSKSLHISGTSSAVCFIPISPVQTGISNHKYLFHSHASDTTALSSGTGFYNDNGGNRWHEYGKGIIFTMDGNGTIAIAFRVNSNITVDFSITPQIYDLTAMFGSGNEPASVEEFEKMFPDAYYQYNAGEIVSAGTESVVEQGKNLWNLESYTASDLVDLKTGYWGVKLSVKPNSTYCISVTRDTALCGTYGKLIGADKREIKFFGHKTMSDINAYTGHPVAFQTADEDYVYVAINSFNGFDTWKSDLLKYFPSFQIEKSSTATAYAPFHSNVYPIPEAIRNLPGYGVEGNIVDYENKTYTQVNSVSGTEIVPLETPIVTDISTLIDDDFLRNLTVEAGGSITFKNSNGDSYRIPVPNEEEYIVKLSEVGGTT